MARITRQEAADRLGICVKTLDGLIRRGQLPASKIGPRIVRIDERDLEAYVAGRLVAPVKKAAEPPKMRPKADALDALTAVLFTQMERGSSRDVIMSRIMGNGWQKLRIARRRNEHGGLFAECRYAERR